MNAAIAIEVVKALTMLAMQVMRENGITSEQYEELFDQARAEFEAHNPAQIPDL
jgi:hypothetical protein